MEGRNPATISYLPCHNCPRQKITSDNLSHDNDFHEVSSYSLIEQSHFTLHIREWSSHKSVLKNGGGCIQESLRKHFEANHLELGNLGVGNVATGAMGLTAPKVKTGRREGPAKEKAPTPAFAVYIILHRRTLSSFFTSGFCHDSSVSLFDSERAIICEILFDFIFNFSSSVQSSLLAKQTIITSGAANGQRKRTDQLQLHAELMSKLPLNFFQILFFIGNFYHAKKTNLRSLNLHRCFNSVSKIITGSCISRVCKCHILSVNFIGQQQNKSSMHNFCMLPLQICKVTCD